MAKKGKKKKANLKVLNKASTRLIRQEFVDYDYTDKLSKEEKQWLADFTDEYYNASVGKQEDEGKGNRFHKTGKLVKERQTANNKRNNDVFGKARAHDKLNYSTNTSGNVGTVLEKDSRNQDVEDALVRLLDYRKSLKNSEDDGDNT